jgi:hypothetical protein
MSSKIITMIRYTTKADNYKQTHHNLKSGYTSGRYYRFEYDNIELFIAGKEVKLKNSTLLASNKVY